MSRRMMRIKAALVLAATLAFVLAPFYIAGRADPGQANLPEPQVFQPARPDDFVYLIWAVIYTWLTLHAVFGLFRRAETPAWDRARWPLILSLGPGALWGWLAEAEPLTSLVLIFWMAAMAFLALWRAKARRDRWLLMAPIGVYAGWLAAASLVTLAVYAGSLEIWMGPVGWAYVAVLAAAGLGIGSQLMLGRSPEFGLALAWAILAIAAHNWRYDASLSSISGLAVLAVLVAVARVGSRFN